MREEGWYWVCEEEILGFDEIAYWRPDEGWHWGGIWHGCDDSIFHEIDEQRITRGE